MRILIIDDIREISIPDADIIYARTVNEAFKMLEQEFDKLLLDHDLGEGPDNNGHYILKQVMNSPSLRLPKVVRIISQNPVGVRNMCQSLLHDFGYTQINDRVFVKEPEEQHADD